MLVMVMMRFLISSRERMFQFKIFGLVIEGKRYGGWKWRVGGIKYYS